MGVLSGQRGFSQFGPALPDKTQLGIAVTLGMRYQSGSDAALKATVGYESLNFGSDKALVFQHAPIELISSLKVAPQLWLGWGLRRTVKAELSGSTQPARHLTSNTGLVLEATIPILVKPPTRLPPEGRTERDAVGLRYVRESYRDTVSGISLNAPHISLFFQGYWE
ncbi:hypothetical protein [Leptothrix ochracea]|uniref:hypothetical protein n=1 Tax=Leptothrix ochracea TaxID=735331 RepID=UPI0034E1D7FC